MSSIVQYSCTSIWDLKYTFSVECTSSMVCITPANHSLACEQYNFSLAAIDEWLAYCVLCVTDSKCRQTWAVSCVLFVKAKFY